MVTPAEDTASPSPTAVPAARGPASSAIQVCCTPFHPMPTTPKMKASALSPTVEVPAPVQAMASEHAVEPERQAARPAEEPIRQHAEEHAAGHAAELGQGEQAAGGDEREAEGALQIEHEVRHPHCLHGGEDTGGDGQQPEVAARQHRDDRPPRARRRRGQRRVGRVAVDEEARDRAGGDQPMTAFVDVGLSMP